MSRYNLIEEAWIPARLLDGQRAELGIRQILLRAKEIAVIEDPSPLVTASLHRFLLAVLYRALRGPADIDEACRLFRDGIPAALIDSYLRDWRDRFWLFDDEFPFAQVPGFEPKTWRAWTVLAAEHNADNAKVLFDHLDVERPGPLSTAAAARWILATLTFSVSAGKSELSHTGTAPSATAAMVLPLGRDLHDSLLFSLVPQSRDILDVDLPLWERPVDALDRLRSGAKRPIAGHADRYTWRTRSIRLQDCATNAVEKLAFASGVENASKDGLDPMLGYRVDDKRGLLTIQFHERGLWRDFDSLLPDREKLAPAVIEHATALARPHRDRFPSSVMVLGQANDKAKIKYWRMERYALPQALAGEQSIRSDIRRLLDEAEETQSALWNASRSFARDLLSRGERVPAGSDIANFVEQMPATPWYWSTLEAAFHGILRCYTLECDRDAIRLDWLRAVRDALREAWDLHGEAAETGDVRTLRALFRAEGPIVRRLAALNREIEKYETYLKQQEETT